MSEHYKTYGGAVLFLMRETKNEQQILLQKRQNTGYADGFWDVSVSGHVEEGESLRDALIREAKEELGISIAKENVEFVTLMHKTTDDRVTYYNVFFRVTKWIGEPVIMEPEKCAEIGWFSLNSLPRTLLEDRKAALANWCNGVPYSEFGWE